MGKIGDPVVMTVDWEDICQVLALAEEIAETERERLRLLKELCPAKKMILQNEMTF